MLIFVVLLIAVLAAFLSYYYIIPRKDTTDTADIPDSYIIESDNRIDIQKKFECAAFSSAYLLRHFDIEADGDELYHKYPHKLFGGNVAPKGVVAFFRKRGFDATFHNGSIPSLKKHISQGIPVIVFTRVFPGKRYLHFVPVIGYDEKHLYFAESLKYLVNCNEKYYNRKMLISEFEAVWRTWVPFCNNTYILIRHSSCYSTH